MQFVDSQPQYHSIEGRVDLELRDASITSADTDVCYEERESRTGVVQGWEEVGRGGCSLE
jgi:hypothetical protein